MERLATEDRLMLEPDEFWPQDIGALAILDGAGSMLDPDGRFRIEAARRAVEATLPLVPRFRVPRQERSLRMGIETTGDLSALDSAGRYDHTYECPHGL